MEEQLMRFAKQFDWQPEIERKERMPQEVREYVVCGMGGSHMGANFLQPHLSKKLTIHSDYGLPTPAPAKSSLIIASSYSGETEETLDAAQAALAAGYPLAVVTTGGALLRFAEEHNLPTVVIPLLDFVPRMAIGASMLALTHLMGERQLEEEVRTAGKALDVARWRSQAVKVSEELQNTILLIYASNANEPLSRYWKIVLNETGKTPAFFDVYPELCHNESSGFDATDASQPLDAQLQVVHLTDETDNPRIVKRMDIMREILEARGVRVSKVPLEGATLWEKYLQSIVLSGWTAFELAKKYGAPDAATPLVDEFKKRMLS